MASNELIDIHNHGVVVDPLKQKVKCNYCDKVVSSGFYRLKYHLGGIKGDVSPCSEVPVHVKEVFRIELAEKKRKRLVEIEESKPAKLRSQLKRKSVIHIDKAYGNDANAHIDRLEGQITDHIPSFEELKGWISKDKLITMQKYVEEIKISWETTGCSILLDTWTDSQDRKLINILVNCPKGAIYLKSYDISTLMRDVDAMQLFIEEVIQDVGIKNVVQIITNSMSIFMEVVGQQIMAKHKHIFWTIGVSTCIELMLKKFKTMNRIRKVLGKAESIAKFIHNHATTLKDLGVSDFIHNPINPSKVRSIVSYLTLENTLSKKDILECFFASDDWKTSNLSNSPEGERVAALVRSSSFWNRATVAMKASSPLLHELHLLKGNNKPQTGYIYEKIDQLKETIEEKLERNVSHYMPFWEAIDEIWNNYFHSSLFSAGYYLNPILFYSNNFKCDLEVVEGLSACIVRMGGEDYGIRASIRDQAVKYLMAKRSSSKHAMNQPPNSSPVLWWWEYAAEYPELSRIAIRILSQTCDGASKFNLNRNLAEMLTSEKRQTEQQMLTDYAFIHYNMQLRNFDSDIGP
ncbi:hypothetical protein BUALT_Bualt10G0025700 [Buddleja alternifolia]|uniref:BED-type domain-containing protein n=1 Tax=Buddleja alternifolia TaxID=168488 RepID=A0AAV6WXB6_9LAMI|nr:hypothetical protein BUALT_Bualt10G0025700 [Buddleja alternifolia]